MYSHRHSRLKLVLCGLTVTVFFRGNKREYKIETQFAMLLEGKCSKVFIIKEGGLKPFFTNFSD